MFLRSHFDNLTLPCKNHFKFVIFYYTIYMRIMFIKNSFRKPYNLFRSHDYKNCSQIIRLNNYSASDACYFVKNKN